MCGVAGIYAYSDAAPSVDETELLRIRDRMISRGSDGAGLWLSPNRRVGLAHRRLAIIDLTDAGAQPMKSGDGRYIITFNGEIYNYKSLREKLFNAGYQFKSHCDTEVLLHLYDFRGADMVRDLRGMFAFAIWDNQKKDLFLARDPNGIKPLYYANEGGSFRFASGVKALLAGGAISREPDRAGQAGFYLTGSVPEPFTTFRAIRSLPAGTSLRITPRGAGAPNSYQTIANIYHEAAREIFVSGQADRFERARTALLDSVRSHLVADVPVGAFLSAGVDAGALVGLMRDAGADNIQTVTLAFEEFRGRHDDEAPLAAEIAAHYQTQHSTRLISADEFRGDLPKIIDAMDQPSTDGINSWFVSKAAREVGLKVAISGLGGDELVGGYPSFSDIPRWRQRVRPLSRMPGLGVALRKLGPICFGSRVSPKAFGLIEYGGTTAGAYFLRRGLFMPWELGAVMGRGASREGLASLNLLDHIKQHIPPGPVGDFAKIATLESSLYMRNQLLRDTDWASMAHSLEVRVPLVDVPLLRAMVPLTRQAPGNEGKALLAAAPRTPLPKAILERRKTGFAIPVGRWAGLSGGRTADPAYGHIRSWAREIAAQHFEC